MKKLLLILTVLLFLPLVLCVPPVTTTKYFADGFNVVSPIQQIMKQNHDYGFAFQVYNISNGVQIINGISCHFHIHSGLGKHIALIHTNVSGEDGAYLFNLSAGNFSEIGIYNYVIHCNNSLLGGYEVQSYAVTYNGELTEQEDIILVIAFLALAWLCLGLGFIFEGKHWILKTFFYFCAVLMGILSINSARIIIGNSNNLLSMSLSGLVIFIVIFAIFLIYMFVYAFIEIIKSFREKQGVRWNYD